MAARTTYQVVFEDGTTEPLYLMPGAPGDKEYNFAFRDWAWADSTNWAEAVAGVYERLPSVTGKAIRSIDGLA